MLNAILDAMHWAGSVAGRKKKNRMSSNHNAQSGWAVRWKYVIHTHKDYAARLNRSVEVEQALLDCASGKRPVLSRDECRQLAVKLGVPECFRSPNGQALRPAGKETQ